MDTVWSDPLEKEKFYEQKIGYKSNKQQNAEQCFVIFVITSIQNLSNVAQLK